MLAKKNRLTVNELKNVGRFSLYRGIFFDAKKSKAFPHKYAIVISAKSYKKAVERNEIRRFFYRILQVLLASDKLKEETILFYPKKGISPLDHKKVVEEIIRYLAQ